MADLICTEKREKVMETIKLVQKVKRMRSKHILKLTTEPVLKVMTKYEERKIS